LIDCSKAQKQKKSKVKETHVSTKHKRETMKFFLPSGRSLMASSRWALVAQQHAQQRTSIPACSRVIKGCTRRALSAATASSSHQSATRRTSLVAIMGAIAVTIDYNNRTTSGVLSLGALSCDDVVCSCDARVPSSGDVFSVGKITKEPATGISFPALCNAMSLAGVGVRVKYVFVNVYAVGAYFDPIAMMAVKRGSQGDIEKALLDPTYPRTIRIVMNRGLSGKLNYGVFFDAIELLFAALPIAICTRNQAF